MSVLLSLTLIENAPFVLLLSEADTDGTPAKFCFVAPLKAFEKIVAASPLCPIPQPLPTDPETVTVFPGLALLGETFKKLTQDPAFFTSVVLENSAERTRRHTMRVDTLWIAAFVGIVWGAKSVFGKNAK